jgi:hypothetical protein
MGPALGVLSRRDWEPRGNSIEASERKITHENYTGGCRHICRARGSNHENNHHLKFETAA